MLFKVTKKQVRGEMEGRGRGKRGGGRERIIMGGGLFSYSRVYNLLMLNSEIFSL
jgi:hypothetical protein